MTAITFRAPTESDGPRVLELLVERDIVDLGQPDCALEDVYDDWSGIGFDLAADARVAVSAGGRIVGYAVIRAPGTLAVVAPDYEGRGIGIRLLTWSEARDRELHRQRHRQGIAAGNTRARELLLQTGYRYERSYFRLAIALDRVADTPSAPDGVLGRPLHVERDAPLIHALHTASFNRQSDYRPQSLAEFRSEHLEVHDLDLHLSCITERNTATVGFLLARRWEEESVGFIDLLGVHPDHRRRGLATAMLQTTFSRSAKAGLHEVQLGVASDNPNALQLYRPCGMTPRFQIDTYTRPAEERVPVM